MLLHPLLLRADHQEIEQDHKADQGQETQQLLLHVAAAVAGKSSKNRVDRHRLSEAPKPGRAGARL